jgi:hypothetical protein
MKSSDKLIGDRKPTFEEEVEALIKTMVPLPPPVTAAQRAERRWGRTSVEAAMQDHDAVVKRVIWTLKVKRDPALIERAWRTSLAFQASLRQLGSELNG